MRTEIPITDSSEWRVLTQLGDTITTRLLFLNGSAVQEDITIEGPVELKTRAARAAEPRG